MSKTVPQLKKIDRGDQEKVEQISAPYEWQKPKAPKVERGGSEQHVRTVPVGDLVRKRSR